MGLLRPAAAVEMAPWPLTTAERDREPVTPLRFWINRYATVVVTAPIAAMTTFGVVFYSVNAIFQTLTLVIGRPSLGIVLMLILLPVWLTWVSLPAVLTYQSLILT